MCDSKRLCTKIVINIFWYKSENTYKKNPAQFKNA